MTLSNVNISKVNKNDGIKIGRNDAPKKMIEFINLRCPDSENWFDSKNDLLLEWVKDGNLQRTIKLLDKKKPELLLGSVMHRYVPNDSTALDVIQRIFDTQEVWGSFKTASDVAYYAEYELDLTCQNNLPVLEEIKKEAKDANILFVPTIIIGNHFFDQTIQRDELLRILSS